VRVRPGLVAVLRMRIRIFFELCDPDSSKEIILAEKKESILT
jgi:hypothetical protein